MARRNKLGKFEDLLRYKNVLENFDHGDDQLTWEEGKRMNPKGQWNSLIFQNDLPITLELACGKGEYTTGMAEMYPNRNFIGVDIKGARIWKGASYANEKNLTNVAFLRTRIEFISKFFEAGEVDEIWITFADPFLKPRKSNRRLTAPVFLKYYNSILSSDGTINLKTDSCILYYFTKAVLLEEDNIETLYSNNDIYSQAVEYPELDIKTFYEQSHLKDGRKIKFLKFRFKSDKHDFN